MLRGNTESLEIIIYVCILKLVIGKRRSVFFSAILYQIHGQVTHEFISNSIYEIVLY